MTRVVVEPTSTTVSIEATQTAVVVETVEVWTEYGWLSAAQPIVVEHREVSAA